MGERKSETSESFALHKPRGLGVVRLFPTKATKVDVSAPRRTLGVRLTGSFHAHDSKSSARRANIIFSTIINCFTVIIIIIFLTRATDLSRKGGAACGLQTATELAEI